MPVTDELKNKYTCVFDGGLLEHVYNYPVALKNAMNMVAIDGHLILITPGNNYFGHGFYQFSPELFYSILREENGFTDTQVYLCNRNKWYLVQNPRVINHRTEVSPKWSNALLYVISKKIGETPDNVTAFQSDYEEIWESSQTSKKINNISILKKIYHKMPRILQKTISYTLKKSFYKKKFKKVFTYIRL